MRNKSAAVLLGVGVFFVALAILVPTVITPALLKASGEIDLVTHSRSAAQKLNSDTGQLEPITVELTRTVSTHAKADRSLAGSGKTAVFDELLNLAPVGSDGKIQTVDAQGAYTGLRAGASVLAFDRKTGRGVPGFQGDTWKTTGQTVKFPFDVQKKTYQYFDQTSHQAWPVSFVRTTTVKGLDVYEFHGTVAEMSLGQYGVLAGTDTLYSNTGRTLLVEPVTGAIVSSTTSPQTSIKFADGTISKALLVDELVPTDATVAERVSDAKDNKSKAVALQRAPWLLGVLGLLLLGGSVLLRRRREEEDSETASYPSNVSGVLPTPRAEEALKASKSKH